MSVTPPPYLSQLAKIPENTIGRTKAKNLRRIIEKLSFFVRKLFPADKQPTTAEKNFPD